MNTYAIDRAAFREAMSRMPAAVHLVTSDGAAGRRGVTVTSACSVSDDPPTVLVCLNLASADNARFEANGNFAINLLSADDEEVARAFAGEGKLTAAERFARGEWSVETTGAPLLTSALAAFDCRLVEARTVATHMVLIGEVVAIRARDKRAALLYYDRTFHSF